MSTTKRKPVQAELRHIPTRELKTGLCAWPGCGAAVRIDGRLPKGWHYLLLFRTEDGCDPFRTLVEVSCSAGCLRDAWLCPEHSKVFALPQLDPRLEDDIGGGRA